MKYNNLDLEVFDYHSDNRNERFSVRVSASPAGEQKLAAADKVNIPGDLRQKLRLLDLRGLALPDLIALGETLAALILPPGARTFMLRSRDLIGNDEGLRIRLKLETYALADLPWEYMYVSPADTPADQKTVLGFLALDRRVSLVRYEVLAQAPGTLDPVDSSPLRLVALLSSPNDPQFPALKLDVEEADIQQALKDVTVLRPEFYSDATLDILEQALENTTHMFHFAGHGEFLGEMGVAYGSIVGKGYIVLMDGNGGPVTFPAEKLALNLTGCGVRLAVLGACEGGRRDEVNAWTGVVPALIHQGIPAVVGMQYTIEDANAIDFSRRLYRTLADGLPIDAAVTDGRLAILNGSSDGDRDWGVPVLYLRASEGTLFPKVAQPQGALTWNDILARSKVQIERALRELVSTPAHDGVFIPDVYTSRSAVEDQLSAFLSSDACGFIISGNSGVARPT